MIRRNEFVVIAGAASVCFALAFEFVIGRSNKLDRIAAADVDAMVR